MKIGNLYATMGIESLMRENNDFRNDVNNAIEKFVNNVWGIVSSEDCLLNDLAINTGERVIGAYTTCKGKIWIIADYRYETTTILFPSEY